MRVYRVCRRARLRHRVRKIRRRPEHPTRIDIDIEPSGRELILLVHTGKTINRKRWHRFAKGQRIVTEAEMAWRGTPSKAVHVDISLTPRVESTLVSQLLESTHPFQSQ